MKYERLESEGENIRFAFFPILNGMEIGFKGWMNRKEKKIHVSNPDLNRFLMEIFDKLIKPQLDKCEMQITGQKTIVELMQRAEGKNHEKDAGTD